MSRGPQKYLQELKTLGTMGMSVSAKFNQVSKDGATKSGGVCTPGIVSYRCYVATAEWLSSAVENKASKAQCCNPVLYLQN